MHWHSKPLPEVDKIKALQLAIGVSFEIASLLVQRGIDDFESAKNFFRPELKDLHDPFLMLGMTAAVNRIKTAIDKHEKIMVYGDYDVDGTTSVSLVYSYLFKQLPDAIYYIPDRYDEGYGISIKGIDTAKEQNVSLIIALDCGIKAVDQVAYAKSLMIDFIICDHHLPGDQLPEAIAVLDPKQPACSYPYKELCGCGIGFKLLQALEKEKGKPVESLLPYIDLVAMAIAADIVPITGENRILIFYGLIQINENPRIGILSFINTLKKKLTVSDLVFVIAPRINGAGRIKHGSFAVELLLTEEEDQALARGRAIELFNSERRELDKKITQQALDQIKQNEEEACFSSVVFQPDWHKGVIGIVASRLIEVYYRPTIVFAASGDCLAGSVRSVKGIDVYQVLEACKEHIIQFGGHMYAAGLTIKPEALSGFKKAFESEVERIITPDQRIPSIQYDLEISLDKITPKFFKIISQMGPFGPRNMQPVFLTKNCKDNGKTNVVGNDQSHLRLDIKDASEKNIFGIGFGMANHISKIKSQKPFDLIYTVDENEFRGLVSLQLKVKDLKV